MNINELCELIDKISNKSEIFISDIIKNKIDVLKNFNSVLDARSLTFFTLGRQNVNKNKQCTSCIISSNELSNTLTALTESKYQQEKIIVISIGINIQTEAFENVTDKIIISNNLETIENNFMEYVNGSYFKPLLINIELEFENVNTSSNIIQVLMNKINSKDKIFTNIEDLEIRDNSKLIIWKNAYGVVSRYLGNLTANKENNLYLLTSYESFCKDINSFYTRYITEKLIIFYLRRKNEVMKININNWTNKNNIDFIEIKNERELKDLEIENLNHKTIIEILI